MLADAGASLLVTVPSLATDLDDESVQVIDPTVTRDHEAEAEPPSWPAPRLDQLAYVMYTSGSTGRPKGVMVEHRSLAGFVHWGLSNFSADELDAVLASTSLGFDISILELLVPLAIGGRVVLVENLLALGAPLEVEVTLVNTVPSLMTALLHDAEVPASVRTVVLAGEPLSPELADSVWRQVGVRRVVNAYGPTEDTIYSTVTDVAAGERPSIGRPIPGTQAYVLDSYGQPVPPGVDGELYLGGAGLARGYRRREDLTAERFVSLTLPGVGSTRVYRTGDLARWNPDGSIQHLGRLDDQVKVRGVRIEPGEIESVLMGHPGVRQAVVVPRSHPSGERRLIAYFVPNGGPVPEGPELREFLHRTLLEPMVPSLFVPLDEMPINPNGKLDRARLPDPHVSPTGSALGTETEMQLAQAWQELLELDRPPGPDDDFFELGGQSLLAFKLFDRIAELFDSDLPPNVLVEAGTLRALAARIDSGVVESWRLVKVRSEGSEAPFVYVHTGAGGLFTLRSFTNVLGPDQPFYGIQAYAGDRESSGGLLMSVESTAAECLSVLRRVQPDGPYRLVGHSIGGHVAFAMACLLQAEGERVEFLALLDPPAPHTLRWRGRLVARVRELTGTGPEARRAGVFRASLSAAKRAVGTRVRPPAATPVAVDAEEGDDAWLRDLMALERRHRPGRFSGEMVVFETAETARFTGFSTLGWDRYVIGSLESVRVPGDHVSMLLDPHVHTLAGEMGSRVASAQRGPT